MMPSMGDDPRERILMELIQHLNKRDSDEMSNALKPKAPEGVEVTKIEALPGDGDESPGTTESDEPSDEELDELLAALQDKQGAE